MEVVKKLNVPINYLFDVFEQSIQSDILAQTGKKLTEDEFTNFEYVKEFSKNNKATIHIEKYVRGQVYAYLNLPVLRKYTLKLPNMDR